MLKRLINLLKQTRFSQFRLNLQPCLLCRWPIQVKLCNDEMAVRCTKCGASAVSQSLGQAFKQHTSENTPLSVYELSSTGAFVRFLKTSKHHITLSEMFDDIPFGESKSDIFCQDVQRLTFPNQSFDVCTSSEVFEHVEDDIEGFKEVYRVLKPKGQLLLTVPIDLNGITQERTQIVDGLRQNIMPPEYHSDKLKGTNKVFCYRNYGNDIIQRLQTVGFKNCKIIKANPQVLFGLGRPVIYAQK